MTFDYRDMNAARNGHVPPSGNPLSSGYTTGGVLKAHDDHLRVKKRLNDNSSLTPVSFNSQDANAATLIVGLGSLIGGPVIGYQIGNITDHYGLGVLTAVVLTTAGMISGFLIGDKIDSNRNLEQDKNQGEKKLEKLIADKKQKESQRKEKLAKQCKSLHSFFESGEARTYFDGLSSERQNEFKRFLNDTYIHSGVKTPDDRINADTLFAKITDDTRNGKFLHNVLLHDATHHSQLNNWLTFLDNYRQGQSRQAKKQASFAKKQERFQKMTPYRRIANVVTPIMNTMIVVGGLSVLFTAASQNVNAIESQPMASQYTHYVTADRLNVSEGAGVNFNLASSPLNQGECIAVKDTTSNGWARVTLNDNRSGFVHTDYIERRSSTYNCPN